MYSVTVRYSIHAKRLCLLLNTKTQSQIPENLISVHFLGQKYGTYESFIFPTFLFFASSHSVASDPSPTHSTNFTAKLELFPKITAEMLQPTVLSFVRQANRARNFKEWSPKISERYFLLPETRFFTAALFGGMGLFSNDFDDRYLLHLHAIYFVFERENC